MPLKLSDPSTDRALTDEAMLSAYLGAARRIIALARKVDPESADLPVPACPAWTVRNLLAHITSVATLSSTGVGFGKDPQATVDREVVERATRTMAQIADEFDAMLPRVELVFTGRPVGPLVVDIVSHEQDLRAALGPAHRDHDAGLTEGLAAIIGWVRYLNLVTGPGIVLRTPTSEVLIGGPEIGAEVDLVDDWELFRLLGVRRCAEQLRAYTQRGDGELLFALTSRYPLPERPLEVDG